MSRLDCRPTDSAAIFMPVLNAVIITTVAAEYLCCVVLCAEWV